MAWLRSKIGVGAIISAILGMLTLLGVAAYSYFGTLNQSERETERLKRAKERAKEKMTRLAEAESPSESSTRSLPTETTIDDVPQGAAKRDPVVGDKGKNGTSPEPQAGQLTAGRWSDLDNWMFWTDLFAQNADGDHPHEWGRWEDKWQMFTRRRIGVSVTAGDQSPAVDARVVLEDGDGDIVWRARTDNRGRAELFAGLFGDSAEGPYRVVASSGSNETTRTVSTPSDDGRLSLDLSQADAPPRALDLMFVVDTTGSMGDELTYLQSELGDVVERSQKYFGGDLSIRTSINVYRDTGDDYIVRTHPFRENVDRAVADLDSYDAGGGGNYPEAVDRALAKSIENHRWRDRATARVMFLVLDAPPHDEKAVKERLHEAVETAAKYGVRIVPVAGSGVDKKTEFLLRSLAISTGGTYTFLTDDSGIGGGHIEPTIGDHEVHKLNDLLVTIVHDYTKATGGE